MNGYHLIYCSSDEDPGKEEALIGMLRDRQVDGLIISTTQQKSTLFTGLKKEGFPFVLIDRQLPRLKTNYVGVENYEGAYKATTQLIVNGFRNIALMKISPGFLSTVKERERGYRDAMKNEGIRIDHHWIREVGYHRLQQQVNSVLDELLSDTHPIDSVFSVNNSITVACLEYCRERNIRIPGDLGLVSFDDIDLFRFSQPGITAIAQPLDDIGEEAVKILLDEINEKTPGDPHRKVLPVRFIPRGSCGQYVNQPTDEKEPVLHGISDEY